MGNYSIEGQEYPSVTTISSIIAKPQLIQWAANMATDYILEHLDEILAETNTHHRKDLIDKARYAHDVYRKETATIGTEAHGAIEDYIKDGQASPQREEVKVVYEAFLDWCKQFTPVWMASEKKLHSKVLGVAGTCDALAVVNGELWMIDFKTSKTVDPSDYSLQLAAYGISYREQGEIFGPIKRYVILHLDWREGAVSSVDVTKKIQNAERSYKLLTDFYYSFKKRRVKNERVKEFYP